jgi:hypothetical protein
MHISFSPLQPGRKNRPGQDSISEPLAGLSGGMAHAPQSSKSAATVILAARIAD